MPCSACLGSAQSWWKNERQKGTLDPICSPFPVFHAKEGDKQDSALDEGGVQGRGIQGVLTGRTSVWNLEQASCQACSGTRRCQSCMLDGFVHGTGIHPVSEEGVFLCG